MATYSKKKAQIQHSKLRARSRLNVDLTTADIAAISGRCRNAKLSVILDVQSLRVAKKAVFYKDKWYIVIYDRSRRNIATFLTIDMLSPEELNVFEQHKQKLEKTEYMTQILKNGG